MKWAKDAEPGVYELLKTVKDLIPKELRVADTIWTAHTLVGDLEDGCNHLDTATLLRPAGSIVTVC
jgi:hypothetical protein